MTVDLLTALVLVLGLIAGLVWAALGRAIWWVPAFVLSFAGGHLNLGVRIYPHEIGIMLSAVALAALIVFDEPRRARRPSLDWSLLALAAYMLAHAAVSIGLSVAGGTPGVGTIARHYVGGLWGIGFAALFWWFGSLRYFRAALVVATVVCAANVLLGAFGPEPPGPLQTADPPGVWLIPPTPLDLRVSAPQMIGLLVIWFYRTRSAFVAMGLALAAVAAAGLAWLGASRVAALGAVAALLLWALVQRRRAGLVVGTAFLVMAATLLVAVNVSATVYDGLPSGVRRSVSAFVFTREVEEHVVTAGSNEWHAMLLASGWRRWLRTPVTFAFGNAVEGWDPAYDEMMSIEERAEVAANLAVYESAAATTTATLGLAGLLLWLRVLFWLYRPFAMPVIARGIRGRDDALAFVAVQSLIVFALFSWIAGSYPVTQCVLGVLAGATMHDRRLAPTRRGPAGPSQVLA